MFENYENDQSMRDTQFEAPSQLSDGYVSGVENVSKESRAKKAVLIGGLSAAVIAGGSAAAYGLSDTVKNQVKLRLSKPESYYAWVTENNADNIGSKAAEFYRKRLDLYEKGQSGQLNITFEPTADGKETLYDELFRYNSGDDPIKGVIDSVSEIGLDVEGSVKKGSADISLGLNKNGSRLVNFDIKRDSTDNSLFMRIPQLKEQWVYTDLGKIESEVSGLFMYGRQNKKSMISQIINDPASFLSPEELEEEINRYAGVWSSVADDVKIEKKESVDICDITSDYTVASLEFTEKDVDRLELAMLKELRDDKIMKGILVDKTSTVEESKFYEDIDNKINNLEQNLENGGYGDDVEFTVDTYIDGAGVIRGISFVSDDDSSTFIIGKDGDRIRGYISRVDDGEEQYRAELYAEEDGKKYSGEVKVNYIGSEYKYNESKDRYSMEEVQKSGEITFRNAELVNEDKLYFNCDLSISFPDGDPVEASFSTDGKSQNISYRAVFDEVDYGELRVKYTVNNKADIEIPERSGAFEIDPDNMSDFNIEDYASWDEIESFLRKFFTDLGVDEETAESAASGFVQGASGSGDYVNDFIEESEEAISGYDDEDNFSAAGSGYQFDIDDYDFEDFKDNMTEEEFDEMLESFEELNKKVS